VPWGQDLKGATRKLDQMSPSAATALTELDVCDLMRCKPESISTSANGARLLTWRTRMPGAQVISVSILFTPDHRFDRIRSRVRC